MGYEEKYQKQCMKSKGIKKKDNIRNRNESQTLLLGSEKHFIFMICHVDVNKAMSYNDSNLCVS